MKDLIINGKTEDEIIRQIINNEADDERLKKILEKYESSTGLDSLKKNMSEFYNVK